MQQYALVGRAYVEQRAHLDRAEAVHVAQGDAFVELCSGAAQLDEVELELGALELLPLGAKIACRGEQFTIVVTRGEPAAVGASRELPTRVEIEMLPRGGRVAFTLGRGAYRGVRADRGWGMVTYETTSSGWDIKPSVGALTENDWSTGSPIAHTKAP